METVSDSKWSERAGGAAGIAFVSLVIASTFFGGSSFSGYDNSAAAVVGDLAKRHEGLETSVALVGLAVIAGFWFVGSVHTRLTARGSSTAAWAALGGGIGTMTFFLAGSAITGAAVSVPSLAGDPQVAKALWLLELSFIDVISPALIVFILGVSVVSIRGRDLPRWLGWSGVVGAVGLTVNTALKMGSLAVLGLFWVLALAITMTVRPQPDKH